MVIFIHGYGYNIAAGDDPEEQYRHWRNFTNAPQRPRNWQSIPSGKNRLSSIFGAWFSGSWNTYHWAWKRSTEEAQRVADYANSIEGEVDIVCHSLGSRVAYEAARIAPQRFRKILAFNGADSAEHARKCAIESHNTEFTSVMYSGDKVLGFLGRAFTPKIGFQDVVGHDRMDIPPSNFKQIELTKEEADGPGLGDHSYSFENPDLWERWRKTLQ